MTIILTCLTNEYVIQASDRQLSTRDEKGRVKPTTQHSNKALTYRYQFSFAYTGLSELPNLKSGQTAIDWAAERLQEGKSLDEAVENLRYRIADLMRTNPMRKLEPHEQRLAFVGAGFEESVSDGQLIRSPVYIMIENFIKDDGSYLNEPRGDFRVVKKWLDTTRGVAALYVAGARLDNEQSLERLCKQYVQRNFRPEDIGVLLVKEIQALAKKDNSTVGKHSMCTFVPRAYADFSADNYFVHASTTQMENPLTSATPGVLKPVKQAPLRERIVILGKFDMPRSYYIDGDGEAMPSYSPSHVATDKVVPSIVTEDISLEYSPSADTGVISDEG